MYAHTHYKEVCKCGAVVSQCRCISQDKVTRTVCNTCPKCEKAMSHQENIEQIPPELQQSISFLRQWLNEDRITDPKKLVGNDDIWHWLSEGIATAQQREVENNRQETMRAVIAKMHKLVDEPNEAIYLEEIEEALYELDEEALRNQT